MVYSNGYALECILIHQMTKNPRGFSKVKHCKHNFWIFKNSYSRVPWWDAYHIINPFFNGFGVSQCI